MAELPTCACVRGLPPYDRLTAIYQAAALLSGDDTLPDVTCVAGVPPLRRFAYIYAALRVLAEDDTLPSMECVEGETPSDQSARIYQAVAIYANDDTLLSYECVRGLPLWQQWQEIYRALYLAAGSPEDQLDPLCVNTTFDILSEVFCVLAAGEAPCVIPELVSATIVDGTLTLVFSEEVTGHDGFFLEIDGGAVVLTYDSGEGTNTLVFTTVPAAAEGEEVVLDYNPGDVESGADCPLAEIDNFEVTNNTVAPTEANLALDFSAVADGTLASETIFNNAKIGGVGWTADFAAGVSQGGTPLNIHIVEDLTSPSYSAPFAVGATEYSAEETKVVRVGFVGRTGNDNKWERFNFNLPAAIGPDAVVQFFYKPCRFADALNSGGVDLSGFANTGDFAMADSIINILQPDEVGDVHAHTNSGHNIERPNFAANTWYKITLFLNGTGNLCEVLAQKANGDFHYYGTRALVGGSDVYLFNGPGNYLLAVDRSQFAYYKGFVFGTGANATLPFGEFSLNGVTDLTGGQSGIDEASITYSAPGFGITGYLIERKEVGGSYSTLAASHATTSYTDSTVADLTSYVYRVSPIVLGVTGTSVESGVIVIDNSTFGTQVSDDFNRANGGLGANWQVALGSNMAIVSNEVKTTIAGVDQFAFWNADTFGNDQYSKIVIGSESGSESKTIVAVRCSGVGSGTFRCYWARKDGIHRFSPGYAPLGGGDLTGLTVGDTLEIRVVGDQITRWRNGVQFGSAVTDTNIASGKPGMGQWQSSGAATMDDFEGGDL